MHEAMGDLAKDMRTAFKPEIAMEFTQEYMDRQELVNWLGQSDLNIFLATPERGEITGGALLASTDLAITSRAPLMVSKTLEARHLQQFMYETITEAICEQNAQDVEAAYEAWSPEAFAASIDEHAEKYL